jgi:hypothetical protein
LRLIVNDVGPDAFQAEIPIEGIDRIGDIVGDDIWSEHAGAQTKCEG